VAIERMNASVAHRGPDDEGSWLGENFAFGMRRLSIIDLPGGRQPMWDERSGIGIVYNGEVYNYRALRGALEKIGIQFRTTSDSEVVLKSLAVKGPAAVHEWNGMFAVASWNSKESKLLLIRDRMGVKPLYYYWNGSILLFASEIKALLASGLFKPQLNPQAIWDYLTFRYVPGPQSIWHNVWKLPPAHMLEWSPGAKPAVSQYWQTDVVSAEKGLFLDRGIRDFESLFLDAVELRMLASDVPVGVFLSGGLDSSAVAAAAVELGHKNFNTFSVGFADGGEFSELVYARRVAEHLRSEHHEVIVDQSSFLEILPEAIRSADEPLADLTMAPLLALSRLARDRVKVVLSGEGGDEILAGYSFDQSLRHYRTIKQLQTLHPSILKGLSQAVSLVSTRYGDTLDRLSRIPVSDWNSVHKIHMTNFWAQAEKAQFWPTFCGLDSGRIISDMYLAAESKDPLEQLLSVYQKSWLVEDLLMKADKMSMAASLEVRVPLLDYRLIEWANCQPVGIKVGRSRRGRPATKFVLRQFARNRLPRAIIDRPKQGFPVPAYVWLQQDKIMRWALEQLTGAKSRLKPVFEPSSVEHQLSLASKGDLAAAHKTWLLLVLEIWLREYDVEFLPHSSSPALVPNLSAAVFT
jgi:asparagine synthase (glutamine-hydrolysing)